MPRGIARWVSIAVLVQLCENGALSEEQQLPVKDAQARSPSEMFDKWLMTTDREFQRPHSAGPTWLRSQGRLPPDIPYVKPNKSVWRFKVGQSAPNLTGWAPDGSAYDVERSCRGKYILVSYWSLKDKRHKDDVLAFERLSQKYKGRSDFQMASYWTDYVDEYLDEMSKNPELYGQRQWWPMAHFHVDRHESGRSKNEDNKDRIGWDDIDGWKTPVYFLIDKDHKFRVIDIPQEELEKTVESALNP